MEQKIFESGASLDDAAAMADFLAPIPNGERLASVLGTRKPVSTRAYDDEGWRARFVISDGINVKCFTVNDITIDEAEMIAAQCPDGQWELAEFEAAVLRALGPDFGHPERE